jgi:hypothetical protein
MRPRIAQVIDKPEQTAEIKPEAKRDNIGQAAAGEGPKGTNVEGVRRGREMTREQGGEATI